MTIRLPALLALAPLLAAAPPPDTGAPAPVTSIAGEHFDVYVYFEAAQAGELALQVAEAARGLAVELFGEPPASERMVLHLYPDAATYAEAERTLTGGFFRDNLAFTAWSTKESHVAVQPSAGAGLLGELGLPPLTRRLVAHEVTHQVCYRTLESHRRHPEWISEGLANWVADEVARSMGWSAGPRAEPLLAHDVFTVRRLLIEGRLPSITQILETGIRGKAALPGLARAERYALYWLLIDYLRAPPRRGAFDDVLARLRGIRDDRFPWIFRDEARGILCTEGTALFDRAFAQHVFAGRSDWRQAARDLATIVGGYVQTAFPFQDASAWRTGLAVEGLDLSGRLRFLSDGATVARIMFAGSWAHPLDWQPRTHLCVELDARGRVQLVRRGGEGNDVLARVELPELASPGEHAFRLAVESVQPGEGDEAGLGLRHAWVRVWSGGELLLDVLVRDLATDCLRSPWGIGVAAGGSVTWTALVAAEGAAPEER